MFFDPTDAVETKTKFVCTYANILLDFVDGIAKVCDAGAAMEDEDAGEEVN